MPATRGGVLVVGVHRSGTSATARLVNLLGVPIGNPADLKPPSAANASGYWEADSLTAYNDRLLRFLGGSWGAPPRLAPLWETVPGLSEHRQRARRLFRRVHRTPQWVWKDPRTSVTLPFWLRVLEVRPVIVLTFRHPLEVARSLSRLHGIRERLAFAIWDRYMRETLAASVNLPVFVLPYDGLVRDPLAWHERLRQFLELSGISCAAAAHPRAVTSFIDPALRHETVDAAVTPELRPVVLALEARAGGHQRFEEVRLPAEGEWVESELAERRSDDLARWSEGERRGALDQRFAFPAA